jgi:cytoskeletal protein RodZ
MAPPQLSEQQIRSIASALRAAREQQGENLAEVAFRIALSPSQLRAIESGDLQPFYSPGYFLQAVQRYADFLGITLPPMEPEPSPDTAEAKAAVATASAPEDAAHTESVDGGHEESTPAQEPGAPPLKSQGSTAPPDPEPDSATPPVHIEHAADEPRRGLPWGWVAFGTAGLIALGILKISLEKPTPTPPAQESLAAAEATKTTTADGPATPGPAASAPAAAPNTPTGSPSSAASVATPAPPKAANASTAAPTTAPTATAPNTKAAANPPSAAPTPAPVAANSKASSTSAGPTAKNDSKLESQASTWVQIVKSNGEKVNLKIEPGEAIDFPSGTTAAIVFGQPDKATLKVQGKPVNIAPFITTDTPPRALVILNQIK